MKSETKPKALIIEDDLNQARVLKVWLESVGYFATIAKDYAEGEQALATIPNLEMVTLDLNLPDSRALSTLERIKDIHTANPTAYLLVISGVLTHVDSERALQYGATAVIEKHEIPTEKSFFEKLRGIFSINTKISPSDLLVNGLITRLEKRCGELGCSIISPPSEIPTANG